MTIIFCVLYYDTFPILNCQKISTALLWLLNVSLFISSVQLNAYNIADYSINVCSKKCLQKIMCLEWQKKKCSENESPVLNDSLFGEEIWCRKKLHFLKMSISIWITSIGKKTFTKIKTMKFTFFNSMK